MTAFKKPKKRSKQNWPAYYASAIESECAPKLLKSLCDGIEEPKHNPSTTGLDATSRREAILGAVMTLYSGRRAKSDLKTCVERGYLSRVWDYNTFLRVLEDTITTEILMRLIEESAALLAKIENLAGEFTQCSRVDGAWFDQRLHVMIGAATNVVTSARVSPVVGCALLPELLAATAKRFTVKEVSADRGYLSDNNLEAINEVGAIPLIPFKQNHAVGRASRSIHWRKMWAHFSFRSEDFQRRYQRTSKRIERAIGAIKALAGGSVRSKSPLARANQLLVMVLLHNLICVCHAIGEFGIEVDLGPKLRAAKP